jgi:tetratricopeptide (TPR) repeat protein
MKRRLKITGLVLLVLVAGGYAWRSFAGRDRAYYGRQSEAAMRVGDWPRAAGYLQRLVSVDPENDEGRWFLSVVYQRMIQKEGQALEDVPETKESLAMLQELNRRRRTRRVDLRLLRHYARVGERERALILLASLYKFREARRDITSVASKLLVTTTGIEESDRILRTLDDNFDPVSLLYIRLKASVYVRDGRTWLLNTHLTQSLGHLSAAHPSALQKLTQQGQQLLTDILQAVLQFAPNSAEADRRLIQSLEILKHYGQKEDAEENRLQIAEIALGLSATVGKKFPLPPIGFGGEATRRRMAEDRRLRREAARMLLEFGMPLVESGEASPLIYEYVARAAMEVEDDSRQVAIFREGLRLYGDLPPDLRGEILEVHRDTALKAIAEGQATQAEYGQLMEVPAGKPLGHLVAGYVAVEHGRITQAQQHVALAKEDKSLRVPAAMLQSRIHLATARWQSSLDVLVPLEQRWDELSSAERVWLTKTLGGRSRLWLTIAFCHLQLGEHKQAIPLITLLETGANRPKGSLLRVVSLVRRNKWAEARAVAATAHQADPNNFALLMAEFMFRVREGQTDRALALLYRFSSLYPSELRLRIVLARWLTIHGETDKSLALLEQTIQQFPNDQVGPLMAAEMLQKLNREEDLDTVLKSLNRPSTSSAIVLLSACSHLRKAGLDDAADALFEAAPGLPSAQEFALSTAILALSRGQHERAIDLLTATLDIPRPLRRGQGGYLENVERQMRNVSKQDLSGRIENLLKTYPREPALLLASAELASRRGDVETALARLQRLEPLDSVPGRVEYRRAQVLTKAGQIDESRKSLAVALEQTPQNNEARTLAAEQAWKQGDFETTLKHLDLANAKGRTTAELVFIRADSLLQLDRKAEAEPVYMELLQRDPKRQTAWMALVGIQTSGGRIAEAIASLEAGLNQLPDERSLQEEYIRLLGDTRQLAKLDATLKRFSKTPPNLRRCLHLAEVYIDVDDLGLAQHWLTEARRIVPDAKLARLMFMEAVVLHGNGLKTGRHSFFFRAREKYTELLERHPNHIKGFSNFAWLLLRRFNATDEAGSFARGILARVPERELPEEAIDSLTEALRQSSQTQRALSLVLGGLERFPDSAALRFQYGALVYEMSGGDEAQESVAREHLMKARELELPPHHTSELEELLAGSPASIYSD